MKNHNYQTTLIWRGNKGVGTSAYTTYERDFTLEIPNKDPIQGSSDPSFRGNPNKYNPEEMFVASLSSCHMLWYLHLCSEAGVVVVAYEDKALGTMKETENGSGLFTEVILYPNVIVQSSAMLEQARILHHKAHEFCFIANSVNFPILVQPIISSENT